MFLDDFIDGGIQYFTNLLETIDMKGVKDIIFDSDNINLVSRVIKTVAPKSVTPFIEMSTKLITEYLDESDVGEELELSMWGNPKLQDSFRLLLNADLNNPEMEEAKTRVKMILKRLGLINSDIVDDILFRADLVENDSVDSLVIDHVVPTLVDRVMTRTCKSARSPSSLYYSNVNQHPCYYFDIPEGDITYFPSILEVDFESMFHKEDGFVLFLSKIPEHRRTKIIKELSNKLKSMFPDHVYHDYDIERLITIQFQGR